MKSKHFLVKRAYTFEERGTHPDDCVYDELKGLWVWNKDKEILVKSDHPKRSNLTSKKQNVEKT